MVFGEVRVDVERVQRDVEHGRLFGQRRFERLGVGVEVRLTGRPQLLAHVASQVVIPEHPPRFLRVPEEVGVGFHRCLDLLFGGGAAFPDRRIRLGRQVFALRSQIRRHGRQVLGVFDAFAVSLVVERRGAEQIGVHQLAGVFVAAHERRQLRKARVVAQKVGQRLILGREPVLLDVQPHKLLDGRSVRVSAVAGQLGGVLGQPVQEPQRGP